MAYYRRTSRIVPVVLVIVVIIIAIAALVSLARVVFFSGNSNGDIAIDTSRESLLNTSLGHSVSMTVRGPIVADEEFNSYKIEITPDKRTIRTFTGYLDRVIDQRTLGNNVAAYDQFVHALDKANLAKGKELVGDRNDIRGICATGRVIEYAILEDNKSVKTLWTSTCSGSPGSLNAAPNQLTNLFVKQIPDASKLIRSVGL